MVSTCNAEQFSALVGESFHLKMDDMEELITLHQVQEFPNSIPEDMAEYFRTPFNLVFKIDAEKAFCDGNHVISHQKIEALEGVFINRILPQGDPKFAWYQVAFN